jgi:hypothetical protein
VRNSAGVLAEGVDVRGTGGYVVAWFLAGYGCLEAAPVGVWPAWLTADLARPVAPVGSALRAVDPERALEGVLARLAGAVEGERNTLLHWAACRFFEHGRGLGSVEAALMPVALGLGLDAAEVRATVASASRQPRRGS